MNETDPTAQHGITEFQYGGSQSRMPGMFTKTAVSTGHKGKAGDKPVVLICW